MTVVLGGGGSYKPTKDTLPPAHNPTAKNKQRRGQWLLWVHTLLLPLWVKALSKTALGPSSEPRLDYYSVSSHTEMAKTSKWPASSVFVDRVREGKAFYNLSALFSSQLHSGPSSPHWEGGLEAQ